MLTSTVRKDTPARSILVDHKAFAENFNRTFSKKPNPCDLSKHLPPLRKPHEQLLIN